MFTVPIKSNMNQTRETIVCSMVLFVVILIVLLFAWEDLKVE